MPPATKTGMFPARLDRLRSLRAFLEDFCADARLRHDECLRVNVVLEELFTNTVRHGHGGDSDSPVWIALRASPGTVHLTYEDCAPPFNPYRSEESAIDTTRSLDRRKLGGLGVFLTRRLAHSQEYAYLYGRNRIRLAIAL